MLRPSQFALAAGAILLSAAPATAHPGHGVDHTALQGFLHPLSGMDHVVAMLAVGLLALYLGGRAFFAVPLAFVSMMALGAALAAAGVAIPGVEQGIAASTLVLGLMIVAAARLPLVVAMLLAGGFAIFHGAAHAIEGGSGGVLPVSYVIGFLLATLVLHLSGIALGAAFTTVERKEFLQRVAGAAIGVAGMAFILG